MPVTQARKLRFATLLALACAGSVACKNRAAPVTRDPQAAVEPAPAATSDAAPDGTALPTLTWSAVSGLSDAVALVGLSSRVCALRVDGQIVCWADVEKAAPIAGLQPAVALSADRESETLCAAQRDGRVQCLSLEEAHARPIVISGARDAVGVAIGSARGCMLDKRGAVRCWDREAGETKAIAVRRLPSLTLIQVEGYEACGIDRDRTLWCWYGDTAEPAQPRLRTCAGGPSYLDGFDGKLDTCGSAAPARVTDVRGLVLRGGADTGELYFVLAGERGYYGYMDRARPVPARVDPYSPFAPKAIDVIEPFSLPEGTVRLVGDGVFGCAVTGAGVTHCWGDSFGQVPQQTTMPAPLAIATSEHHLCALRAGGTVACAARDAQATAGANLAGVVAAPVIPDGLERAPRWIYREYRTGMIAPSSDGPVQYTLQRSNAHALLTVEHLPAPAASIGAAPRRPGVRASGPPTRTLGTITTKGAQVTITFDGNSEPLVCRRGKLKVARADARRAGSTGKLPDCGNRGHWVPGALRVVEVLRCNLTEPGEDPDRGEELAFAPSPGIEFLYVNDDCDQQGGGYRAIANDGSVAAPR